MMEINNSSELALENKTLGFTPLWPSVGLINTLRHTHAVKF